MAMPKPPPRDWLDMTPGRQRQWRKLLKDGLVKVRNTIHSIRCPWCSERTGKTVWHAVSRGSQQDTMRDKERTIEERTMDKLRSLAVNGCTYKKREKQ